MRHRVLVYPAKMNNPDLTEAYRQMIDALNLWDKAVIISLQIKSREENYESSTRSMANYGSKVGRQ